MVKKCIITVFLILLSVLGYCQGVRGGDITNTGSGADNYGTGTTYALIIGISDYPHISPLKYADKDAELFQQFLLSKAGGSVKPENIKVLINDKAKGGPVASALSSMEQIAYKPGDRLYIYLAGHGDGIDEDEYYFLGYDLSAGSGPGDKNNYRLGFALRMYDVKNTIKRIVKKNVQVIFILDACRTNELPGGETGQKLFATGIIEHPVDEIMMLSAGPGQSALESPEIGGGHGLFTWYLVNGLYGEADYNKDKSVTLSELSRYLNDKVINMAADNFDKHEQTPVLGPSKFLAKIVATVDSGTFSNWEKNRTTSDFSQKALAYNDIRGVDTVQIDSVTIGLYNEVIKAIKNNKLIGEHSAEAYYNQLKIHNQKSNLAKDAKYTLAGEFLNYATEKINLYLAGKDQTSQSQYESAINGNEQNMPSADKYRLLATVPYKITADYIAKARELLKEDTAIARKLEPQYLFFLAKSYRESNHKMTIEDAMKSLKKAIKMQPNAAYLHEFLCELYLEEGKYNDAANEIKLSVGLAPSWSYNYCTKGRLHYLQKDYNNAETCYKKAISYDSTYSEAYSNLGNLYLDMNRIVEAEFYYKKSVQNDSSYSVAKSTLLYNLGVFYVKQNNLVMAERYYKEAILADSAKSEAANNLGVLLFGRNDFVAAEYYFLLALRHDSLLFNAYNNLGLVYDTLQRLPEEEACLKKAIKIRQDDGAAYLNLANLYSLKKKDNRSAIRCLEDAVKKGASKLDACCYNLACIYADEKDIKNSLQYFELALKKGYQDYDSIVADAKPDGELFPISDQPKFNELMKKYFPDKVK